MADSILRDKAKVFAKDIIFLCREMKADRKEFVLINQIRQIILNELKSDKVLYNKSQHRIFCVGSLFYKLSEGQ